MTGLHLKKIVLLLAFVLVVSACFVSSLAEDEVKVEVIAMEPAELSEAGTVAVTFEISNHSDYELSDISIVQGSFVYDVAENTVIPCFGSAKIPVQVSVADSQIGVPITFMVRWTCGGEPYFINKEITVGRAVEPVISVTRTASATHARQGDRLTLTYVLKNDTKFDMSDIMLIDEQISDVPIRRNDTLRANDSFTIEYTYTMGTEDVVSAPVVTYTVNGKTKTFSAIEPVALSMVNVDVRMQVEMGTPAATGVPFTITAENVGNQKVSEIYIRDEQGNTVNNTPFSLDVGGMQTLSYTVVPSMTETVRNVGFSLSGVDPFGAAYTPLFPDTYPVYPFVDDSQIVVSILGSVTSEWTAQNGVVGVRLQIQNNSSVELSGAVLSEASLGALANYTVLPGGQTVYESELMIGSPRNLSFTLKAVDPAGTERTVASYLLTVAYPETTEEVPAATAAPEQPQGAGSVWGNTVTRVLIILGAVMVIAFAVLMILTLLERSRAGGSFLLDEDEEEDEDFDSDFDLLDEPEEMPQRDLPPQDAEYLRRAKLYVPPSRVPVREDFWDDDKGGGVPDFDDVLPSREPEETARFHLPSDGTAPWEEERCGSPQASDIPGAGVPYAPRRPWSAQAIDLPPPAYGSPAGRPAAAPPQYRDAQRGEPAVRAAGSYQESSAPGAVAAPERAADATAEFGPVEYLQSRPSGDALTGAVQESGPETDGIHAPKVISVRRQARVQPQRRNTVKRVAGPADEETHE